VAGALPSDLRAGRADACTVPVPSCYRTRDEVQPWLEWL